MSRSNGTEGPAPPPAKRHFYEICKAYNLGIPGVQHITEVAGVSRETVELMFKGEAVKRADAERVLFVLTQLTGETWSLDNVNVPLID